MPGAGPEIKERGGRMGIVKPMTEIWGRSPQRGSGSEPLVRGSGAKPPEARSLKKHLNAKRKWRNKIAFYVFWQP